MPLWNHICHKPDKQTRWAHAAYKFRTFLEIYNCVDFVGHLYTAFLPVKQFQITLEFNLSISGICITNICWNRVIIIDCKWISFVWSWSLILVGALWSFKIFIFLSTICIQPIWHLIFTFLYFRFSLYIYLQAYMPIDNFSCKISLGPNLKDRLNK